MEVMRSSQEALLTIVEVNADWSGHTPTRSDGSSSRWRSHLQPAANCVCVAVQVLLYDPLFDWTMNPLKAFHLQHDEQQELNAMLSSTMGGGDDMVNHRRSGYAAFLSNLKHCHPVGVSLTVSLPPQRQPELQQGGRAGAAAAAGEAEGGGGRHGAQRRGAGQPAHPAGHGPQEPEQALPRLAGLGVEARRRACSLFDVGGA